MDRPNQGDEPYKTTLRMKATLVSSNFRSRLTQGWSRVFLLALEAAGYTLLAVFLPSYLGFAESGIISVFLSAVPLADRLRSLVEENRRLIYESDMPNWKVNRLTVVSLTSIFLGVVFAYVLAVSLLPLSEATGFYDFALSAAGADTGTIFDRSFGNTRGLIAHNLLVALSIFMLSLVYRMYGAMLALCWNACVWASVLTVLIERAGVGSVASDFELGFVAAVAVLPHLMIEGAAYAFVALGAIFLSKGLVRFAVGSAQFKKVAVAAASMIGLGVFMIVLGAVTESTFVPFVLSFVQS